MAPISCAGFAETSKDLGELIERLHIATDSDLNAHEKANVRDARRDFNLHANIPKDLAQKEAQLTAHGYEVR